MCIDSGWSFLTCPCVSAGGGQGSGKHVLQHVGPMERRSERCCASRPWARMSRLSPLKTASICWSPRPSCPATETSYVHQTGRWATGVRWAQGLKGTPGLFMLHQPSHPSSSLTNPKWRGEVHSGLFSAFPTSQYPISPVFHFYKIFLSSGQIPTCLEWPGSYILRLTTANWKIFRIFCWPVVKPLGTNQGSPTYPKSWLAKHLLELMFQTKTKGESL